MTNGYVYVASLNKDYYRAAKMSAESLKDFYPEANITLFTHEEWVTDEDYLIFNNIVTKDVPANNRAKLWALSQTPYDLTMYLDCDTMIEHEDISTIFNYIGNHDIIFTKNRPYNAKITKLNDTEEMIYHCGVFLYKKTSEIKRLMDNWYKEYLIQIDPEYCLDPYPEKVRPWDTFTMWWLLNKTSFKDSINVGEFPLPDARWNFCMGQRPDELENNEVIVRHYTLSRVFNSNEYYIQT
jgi:hypothetical protein|tara:strand:- start:37 stop:753 length:717 start_codon:yes stop_codon:yes gene_type:complete